MGDNTIASVADADVASAVDLNQYKTAITEDFLPRTTAGVVTSAAGSLGSSTKKWDILYTDNIDTTTPIGCGVNHTNFEPLGTIKMSFLSVAQFRAIAGTEWVIMDGNSIASSDLHTLTGMTTTPLPPDGSAMVQTDDDANLGDLTTGENKAHTHGVPASLNATAGSAGFAQKNSNTSTIYTASNGGANNLAAGVKVNYFVKINN